MIFLSAILVLSLAFPICCHSGQMSGSGHNHQTEMSSHAGHNSHSDTGGESCECGHELVKDYKKTKKNIGSHSLFFSSAFALRVQRFSPVNSDVPVKTRMKPDISSDSGPPIYLQNSVFLN